MRDAGGELAERGELLGLDQAVLRGAQILERLRQFARARLHLSNRRTFSIAITAWSAKVCDKLDLLVGEGPQLVRAQSEDADRALRA